VSGMGSHSSSESWRISFNKNACVATIGFGAVLAILMASTCPALSQTLPQNAQTAGGENAQDDLSYLPPSMRSRIESSKSAVTVRPETQVQTPAKSISFRRAARRRARRERRDYVWANGRGFDLFGN